MHIGEYSFGHIALGGKAYGNDVIIRGKDVKGWRRKESHKLSLDDLKGVLEHKPMKLIIGTGHDGCMEIMDDVVRYCRENGISLGVLRTGEAVERFNMSKEKGIVAALHLT